MAKTPRMQWPIPRENADPWYNSFVSLMDAVDASVFASKEDRNIIWLTAAATTFNSGTGVVSWDAVIELTASNGVLWTIPAGSVTLEAGEFAYVTLPRAPTVTVPLTVEKATTLASEGDDIYALCVRRVDTIYWRPGAFVEGGTTYPDITDTAGVLVAIGVPVEIEVGAGQENILNGYWDDYGGAINLFHNTLTPVLQVEEGVVQADGFTVETVTPLSLAAGANHDIVIFSSFCRVSGDAGGSDITGFVYANCNYNVSVDCFNDSATAVDLLHNTGSSANNRILCPNSATLTIPPFGGWRMVRHATTSLGQRWVVISHSA